jgi:hypothetical protein
MTEPTAEEACHHELYFVVAADACYCTFAPIDLKSRGITKELEYFMDHSTVRIGGLEENNCVIGIE